MKSFERLTRSAVTFRRSRLLLVGSGRHLYLRVSSIDEPGAGDKYLGTLEGRDLRAFARSLAKRLAKER